MDKTSRAENGIRFLLHFCSAMAAIACFLVPLIAHQSWAEIGGWATIGTVLLCLLYREISRVLARVKSIILTESGLAERKTLSPSTRNRVAKLLQESQEKQEHFVRP